MKVSSLVITAIVLVGAGAGVVSWKRATPDADRGRRPAAAHASSVKKSLQESSAHGTAHGSAHDTDHASAALPAVAPIAAPARAAANHPAPAPHSPTATEEEERVDGGAPHATDAPHDDGSAAGAIWRSLLAGNQRFVADTTDDKPFQETRATLASGQHPDAIVLGCADSRVGPELVFDQDLGELFCVRTAGNVADAVALGSIEYAVEHLGAKLIVVLGHEKCGAVAAAASGKAMPTPNLQAIVDRIEPALSFLRLSCEGDELVTRGVDANVHCSARALLENSEVIAAAVRAGHVRIVKARYELATGAVRTLE